MIEAIYTCTKCKQERLAAAMSRQSSRPSGVHAWCKQCMSKRKRERKDTRAQRTKWNLRARYSLSPEQVDAMRAQQGGVCAICSGVMHRECVDHDHATGKVRGLLCHSCNVKLHALDKWPQREAAVAYLTKHQGAA